MAITYPLDFSGLLTAARVDYVSRDVVGMSEAPSSLKPQFFAWNADCLRAQISWPPCERADAEEIIAKLLALRGMEGTFEMGPPEWRPIRGAGGGSPVVMGDQGAGGGSLETDGWTAGLANVLLPGDWFELEEDGTKRLHKVLAAASANAYGAATLEIWPRLRAAVADGAALTLVNPRGTWRRASNEQSWGVEPAMIYGIEVEVLEAL